MVGLTGNGFGGVAAGSSGVAAETGASAHRDALPVVGRFAPTPSGRMHMGNAYAMLAAWLSARSSGGRIALRIEDIDKPRVRPDADRWIMDDLRWLGLDWDSEPVYQSQRLDWYEQALDALRRVEVPDGVALRPGRRGDGMSAPLVYPCFCSRADIRAASAPQEGDGLVLYPGTCRRLTAEEREARLNRGDRHSLRVLAPDADVRFCDRVFGPQCFNLARDLGDTVVRRSDGLFSYQLAVVVDDMTMGVTDVVRGRDLLRSTALQLWIEKNLITAGFDGGQVAQGGRAYAHLPLIDDSRGRRLAKRDRALDLGVLRADGVRPEEVVGRCAWWLGLQTDAAGVPLPEPTPMSAAEALGAFSWERVRAAHMRDHGDHRV